MKSSAPATGTGMFGEIAEAPTPEPRPKKNPIKELLEIPKPEPVEIEPAVKLAEVIEEVIAGEELTDHQKVMKILDECKQILVIKEKEYNSGGVKMGDYFPRGIYSAIDIMNGKLLRLYSLLESGQKANEDINETAKSLVNYSAIFLAIANGLVSTPASHSPRK